MPKERVGGRRVNADKALTPEQKEALEYYTQDGYYINNFLRSGQKLDQGDKDLIKLLDEATDSRVTYDMLYRIIDAKTIFEGVDDFVYDNLNAHILLGDDAYDRGAYSQGIKANIWKSW